MTSPPIPPAQPTLPRSGSTLLVRTAVDDDPAWVSLLEAVATPSPDGFLADVAPVDHTSYRESSPEDLRALLPAGEYVSFFFVADHRAIGEPGHPLLVVPVPQPDYDDEDEPSREAFRVVVTSLWAVENNLSLGNMDWDDFASRCDDHGVFRDY